jgi:proteasome assembly chaperone (PAC2) family protein
MGGLCLIGETIGRSMFTDTRASKAVLEVLKKILNVKIDMTDMEKRARELEKAMVKAEEIEKAVMKKMKKSDEFRYIA